MLHMRIRVRGQNIIPEDGPGSGRPDEFEFTFSRDWDRFLKFAQFTQHGRTYNTMLADNRCHLPPEIRSGPYYLNVTGITPDSRDRATSCYVMLSVPGAPPGPPPFPEEEGPPSSLYGELRREMEQMIRDAAGLTLDRTLQEEGMAAESRAAGDAIRKGREEMQSSLSLEAEKLMEEIRKVHARLESAEARLKAAEEGGQASSEETASLKASVAQMQKELEDLDALRSAAESLSAVLGRLETLEAGSTRTAEKLERLEKSSAEADGILSKLESRVPGIEESVEDLSRQTDRRLDALEMLDTERRLKSVEDRADALGARGDAVQEEVRSLRSRTGACEEQMQGLQRTVQGVQTETARLSEEGGKTQEALRRLRERTEGVRELERKSEAADKTLSEHTAAIDVLNKSVLAHTVALEALKGGHAPDLHPHGPHGPDGDGWRRAMRRADDAMEVASRASRDIDQLTRRVMTSESEQMRLQARLEREVRGAVMVQQGAQHAGRILGISEDGRVEPMDRRLQGQVQADLAQTDSAQADYVRSKPFEIYEGYMAVRGLVLLAQDRTPFLLRVSENGDLAVSAFTQDNP